MIGWEKAFEALESLGGGQHFNGCQMKCAIAYTL